MSAEIVELNDANFETAVNAETPILVDFWAAWCGPCRMIAPTLEELAGEYAGRIRIGKLDVDANGQTASRYGIQSIPTLILFHQGQEADKIVGAAARDAISQMLDKHL